MDSKEFVEEILKPALDLVADEYEDDSLSYEDTRGPKGLGSIKVEINGQTFFVGVMKSK